MSIHRRAANIRNVLALVVVAGLVAFLTLKATGSVDRVSGGAAASSTSSDVPGRTGGTALDGEPIAMP